MLFDAVEGNLFTPMFDVFLAHPARQNGYRDYRNHECLQLVSEQFS